MNVFEIEILKSIYNAIGCPFLDGFFKAVTFLGNAGWIWILTALIMLFFKKTRSCAITIALGLIISFVFNNLILKFLIARPRPFSVDSSLSIIISAPFDYSFASGHTFTSFCSAVVLMYYYKKQLGYAALVIASLIAFSRIYFSVHYPTDVLGAMIMGIVFGIISVTLVNHFYKPKKI